MEQATRFQQSNVPAAATATDQSSIPSDEDDTANPSDGSDTGQQWILKKNDRIKYWNAFADVSVFYTGNVALTRRHEMSDSYFVPEVGISYQRPIAPGLTATFSLLETFFRYNRFSALDFDSFTGSAGLQWHVQPLWDSDVFASYSYNRLTTELTSNEIFNSHTISLGIQKKIQIRREMDIYFGELNQFQAADPWRLQRQTVSAFAGYDVQLTRALSADLTGIAGMEFYSAGRRDFTATISAGLHYHITNNFIVNLVGSAGLNDSNESVFDYNVIDGGGGATGSLTF